MSPRLRLATGIGLVVFGVSMAATVLVASLALWRDVVTAETPSGVDYLALYAGGRLFRETPRLLYDLDAQRQVEAALVQPGVLAEGLLPYPYPPYVAALLSTVDGLGFAGSYAAMGALNLALLGLALAVIARRASLTRSATAWLLLATAAALPVWFAMVQGQVSVLVLVLTSLHVFDARDGRQRRAGLWLGLLAFKPQLVVLPAVMAVRRGQWSALFVAAAVTALGWAVVLPRVGATAVGGYVAVLRTLGAARDTLGVHPERMLNLRSVALALTPDPWQTAAWTAGAILVVALLAWPPPDGRPGRRGSVWHWAALVIGMVLVTPHVNLHDLSLLVLVVGLVMSAHSEPVPLGVAAGSLGLLALPGAVVVAGGWPGMALPIAVVPAALVIVFAWLLWRRAAAGPDG